GKAIAERGTVNPMKGAQGQIAGVDIVPTSGRAGAANYNVQIRGRNSLAGTRPLFVVDGIIVDNINFLNPQDISSMDVLKDAASTAIYGSRGSNGVIIITTKTAESASSAPTISLDSYYGLRKTARMPDFMDGQQQWEYLLNSQISGALLRGDPYSAEMPARGNPEILRRVAENDWTDWMDIVLQDGSQNNHWLTASGISKDRNIRYLIGAGYQDEKGNFVQEYINKYSFKASIEARISEKWSTGLNIAFTRSKLEQGSSQAVNNAFRQTPLYKPYDTKDGSLIFYPSQIWNPADNNYTGYGSFVNPILELENSRNTTNSDFGLGNLFLQYSPVNWINIRSTYSPNVNFSKNGLFWKSETQERLLGTPAARINNSQSFSYIWDNMITVNKTIRKDHNFLFTGLHSIQAQEFEANSSRVDDLPFESGWYNMGSSTNRVLISSSYSKVSIESYMARLNYGYRNKYLVELASRWDGSSKLAPGYKWTSFPAASVGWVISEEGFMDNLNFISFLKLRFSAAESGNNDNVSAYGTQATLGSPLLYNFGGSPITGYLPGGLVNSNLVWERTREFNLGLDYELIKGRVSGSIEVYDKLSKGLLMGRNIPVETGWTSITDNVGSVSNRGIELSLRTVNIATKDFRWTTSFNFSRNKNAIRELLGRKEDLPGNSWFIGKPVRVIYNYVPDGVWQAGEKDLAASYGQTPGQARVKDLNGDGRISAGDDYAIRGQLDPKWGGGFSTQLSYKNFDFSASLFARQGMLISSAFNAQFLRMEVTNYVALDVPYYMPANDVTEARSSNYIPQPSNVGPYWRNNIMPFIDASYVKVQNMALGYTFPGKLLERAKIKGLRTYINVLDPFVFTKKNFTGFDPEHDANGATNNTTIGAIIYQLGFNLKF
ncbi:MAG TPA: SusC/RagA family TonB-linked outer membrane protein, partial [Flavitalea sp.]|nr:SusC/RagA family TonB-linked outer membrane protein [Flavitalea sp.]